MRNFAAEYRTKTQVTMNTVTLDNAIYNEVSTYARLNNISVSDVLKDCWHAFVEKVNCSTASVPYTETASFKQAMDVLDAFVADDLQSPVPADEDGKGIVAREKYHNM